MSQIVFQIDHVFVPLVKAEEAFAFLTEVLGLPAAWPYASYGDFKSGGINLRSANLEILQSNDQYPFFSAHHPARVQGIAFEPARIDQALLDTVDSRGVSHSDPMPFSMNGQHLWTNVLLQDLIDEQSIVFLCEYQMPASAPPLSEMRLNTAHGGRLEIQRLEEIVVGSRVPEKAANRWQRLLDPLLPVEPGYWQIGKGPALRVVKEKEAVITLLLRVRSLTHAAAELQALGLSAIRSADQLIMQAPPLAGLDIRLVSSGD